MRKRRLKNILFLLLCALLCGGSALAAASARLGGAQLLETAAFAGSLLQSPGTAIAAAQQVWEDEHPVAGAQEDRQQGSGFWTGLPAQAQASEETEAPPAEEPAAAQQTPAGMLAVEETSYTAAVGGIYLAAGAGVIKNVTELPAAEVAAEIGQPLPFSVEVGSGEPQVLIMHTHTTESYRTGEELWCDPSYPFRSTDNSQNMVAVGAEIAAVLNDAGITTLQDATQHDYPSYNGSYDRSKVTVERYLEQYPSIKVVLDIHRDAIQRENGSPVSAVAEIEGKKAAQVMIICGADDGTMGMPNYKQNLRFAAALQDRLATLFPGFARPVLFDYRNYNQQLTTGSLLIEVGSHGNTLEEAKYAGQLVGQALVSLFAGQG